MTHFETSTGQGYLGSRSAPVHIHPAYNHLIGFIPKNIKDLFDLLWHTYYRTPQINAVLQRKSAYTITDFKFDDTRGAEDWRNIFDVVNVKQALKTRYIDRYVYGSSFHYVYRPFERYVRCKSCSSETRLSDRYIHTRYDAQRCQLTFTCPRCHNASTVSLAPVEAGQVDFVRDVAVKSAEAIRIRRLDPRDVSIEFNRYSGSTRYWYDAPGDMRSRVFAGDPQYLAELPRTMLEAIGRASWYAFDPGRIYHSKVEGPISPYEGWGLPPMLLVLPDIYHVMVLKRANEAISMEYIAPFRVMTPQAVTNTGAPSAQVTNLAQWQQTIQEGIGKWRVDPLHFAFAAVPVEVTTVGGQGRAMMVAAEIEAAEAAVLAGLGWPRELFYGGTGAVSPALLRTIENELINDQGDDERFLRWLGSEIASIMDRTSAPKVTLTSIKLVDDVAQKGMLAQISASNAGGPLVSNTTMAALLGLDYHAEQELLVTEQEDAMRNQQRIAEIQMRYQKRQQAAAQDQPPTDPGALAMAKGLIQQQAAALADELSQLDPDTRRSRLASAEEDPVVYALAKELLANVDREGAYAQSQAVTEETQQVPVQ